MTIYLNGEYMPIAEAKISVLDRGFIFGDGVYEVIPVYSRKAFRLAEHLRRLQYSLDGIRLPNPHSESEWTNIINKLIARNEAQDQYLYLHITRGVAKRDHAFPNPPVKPTVYMMSNPLSTPPAGLLQSGVSAVTAQDNRWLRCDIKAISLLPNVLLRQMAVDAGYRDHPDPRRIKQRAFIYERWVHDRRRGQQHLRGEERQAVRSAQGQPDAPRHHL